MPSGRPGGGDCQSQRHRGRDRRQPERGATHPEWDNLEFSNAIEDQLNPCDRKPWLSVAFLGAGRAAGDFGRALEDDQIDRDHCFRESSPEVIADSAEASVAGLAEPVAAVGDIASGCGPEQSRPQGIQDVREVGVAAAVVGAAVADRIAGSLQNRLRFRRVWVEKGPAVFCWSSAHSG